MVARRERERLCELKAIAYSMAVKYFNEQEGLKELLVGGASKISDAGLCAVAEACTSLRSLNISGASGVTDVSLRAMAMNCTKLTKIAMERCHGVTGPGLSVIGKCCPELQELSLRGCRQIGHWALKNVFNGCPHLEVVDLTDCNRVGDEEIKVMTIKCKLLRHLSLRECKHVSDEALLLVAQCCLQLEWLDLARSDLSFKITDCTLLGLGQNSSALVYLDMTGCDGISDVGISWLAAGCRALQHVNLAGCNKLTNVGVSSLSEQCHDLEWVSIKGLKLCSDVVVGHLSEGCPKLRHLDVSGVFLISDGSQRDFAMTGLQALALSCPELRSLVLDNCFRVAKTSLKALGAGLKNLEHLSLSGCYNITVPGMSALAEGCSSLTSLDLSHCGDAISSTLLQAVGASAAKLLNLRLVNCEAFSSSGMNALCRGCSSLTRLDLTGCTGLGDNAMIPFQQHRMEYLEKISLLGCHKVSGAGVQWLCEGCPAICLLNVKGTGASLTTLNIISERYSECEVRVSDEFFGLMPLKRREDRLMIKAYGKMWKAVVCVQGAWRTRVAREQAALRRVDFYRNKASLGVARLWRVKQGRDLQKRMRGEATRRDAAAVRIQKLWRMALGRLQLQRLRQEKFERYKHLMATVIESWWRGVRGRWKAKLRAIEVAHELRLQEKAACYLQTRFRGYQARKHFHSMREVLELEEQRRERGAHRIQSAVRSYKARCMLAEMKLRLQLKRKAEVAAAIILQKNVRSWRCRHVLAGKVADRNRIMSAAVAIQRHWRGCSQRSKYAVMLAAWWKQREQDAAVTIQHMWKRYKAAKLLRAITESKAFEALREDKAARCIQLNYRCWRITQEAIRIKQKRLNEVQEIARLEKWASTKIEAGWRGKLGRQKAKERKLQHMARWKEMMDQDKGVPFYYNKISGEVRWRRPQAFLELLPRPVCGNCEQFEAFSECQACGEYFCTSCWGMVHGGGLRKLHPFRALYDYYGKRTDYGEGDFPSKWPSEVEQDDINGWKLRVEPIRSPVERQGTWERYEDEASGRDFWRELNTGETSYEPPLGWVEGAGSFEDLVPTNSDTSLTAFQLSYGDFSDTVQSVVEPEADIPGAELITAGGSRWEVSYDENAQHLYYLNKATGEATYDRPAELLRPEPGAHPVETLSDEWGKFYDDEYQLEYYHHYSSGYSTYERPEGFETPEEGLALLTSGL
ncbi:unnamed protein product [Chrysoparadoxa australica]